MLYTASTLGGPAVVRYPRGAGPVVPVVAQMTALPVGRAQTRREGRSGLALLVFGTIIEHGSRESCLAAAGLDAAGLSARVERWWALQNQERLRSASGA